MNLCQREEWELSCAYEHLWKIKFVIKSTLSTTFRSHDENYEWFLSLELEKPKNEEVPVRNISRHYLVDDDQYSQFNSTASFDNYSPPAKFQDYYLQVRLKKFVDKHLITFEKKKIDIQILNANNKDGVDENIKKELCIDNAETIFSIHFGSLEKLKLNTFPDDSGNLTIVVRIFDVSNKSTSDFEKLLKSGDCSDFKIIIVEKEFLVHKSILAARSDYFLAMFKHETKEKIDGVVKIPDVRVEVMNELLRFIYCAKVDLKDNLSFDLLTAADIYQINDLKTMCEKKIAQNLTVENLTKCVVYADTYDNEYLKQKTIEFIIQKKNSGYKFSDDEIDNFKSRLTLVSSSYLTSLVCKFLIL